MNALRYLQLFTNAHGVISQKTWMFTNFSQNTLFIFGSHDCILGLTGYHIYFAGIFSSSPRILSTSSTSAAPSPPPKKNWSTWNIYKTAIKVLHKLSSMSEEKCLGRQRIKSTFSLTCSEDRERRNTQKKRGGRGLNTGKTVKLFYFLPSLSLTLRPWTKKKRTKVYSSEVHVFPKRILCDFCTLMVFVFICYAHKPHSCYGILHHRLLILGAESFISATKKVAK